MSFDELKFNAEGLIPAMQEESSAGAMLYDELSGIGRRLN